MDKMIYHTGHYQRLIKLLPQVSDLGYIYKKSEPVVETFNSCNFSFILRGDGWYYHRGQKLRVIAPAILIQWPGGINYYGADTDWDEYFFMYKEDTFNSFIESGLFNPESPVIPLKSYTKTTDLLSEIVQIIKLKMTVFPADRLDMLCWRVINETPLYTAVTEQLTKSEKKIKEIADIIKKEPMATYDIDRIASQSGMAVPTFRRHWLQYMGVSPGRYIADLKLGISCDLLINTDKLISEIAGEVQFQDALYFSRFFKKKTGLSPRDYRTKYQYY